MPTLQIPNPNWDEELHETEYLTLNAKYEVCPRCEGKGTHSNPSIDGNGITSSEMDEMGEDFRDDYFSGTYDVRCYQCKGERVILVPDPAYNSPLDMKAYEEYQYEKDDAWREQYNEMRAEGQEVYYSDRRDY